VGSEKDAEIEKNVLLLDPFFAIDRERCGIDYRRSVFYRTLTSKSVG
jgi:hypothetical protein